MTWQCSLCGATLNDTYCIYSSQGHAPQCMDKHGCHRRQRDPGDTDGAR